MRARPTFPAVAPVCLLRRDSKINKKVWGNLLHSFVNLFVCCPRSIVQHSHFSKGPNYVSCCFSLLAEEGLEDKQGRGNKVGNPKCTITEDEKNSGETLR